MLAHINGIEENTAVPLAAGTLEKIDMICHGDESYITIECLNTDLSLTAVCKQGSGQVALESELREAQYSFHRLYPH